MSILSLTTRKPITKTAKKKADAIVQHVIESIAPLEVYLIGSMLRGDVHGNSDLDLVVVMPEPFRRRDVALRVLPSRPHMDIPLDLHVVGQREFLKFKDLGGICFEGAHHGKLLYRKELP